MNFRILGPLQVLEAGEDVPLGSPKERALLAVLLLNANEVVSRDRLLDELWGGSAPVTAAKALNVHVSQLRKRLARNGRDPIGTRTPGYVIELDANQLDAAEFEQRAAEAREHAAKGELAVAASLFREALSLWRGPALDGLDLESLARNEIGRLEDLRLSTLMDRVDCDLALGQHEQLVGELEAAVARHPFNERLRSQLMLALYRSNRQADALRAYQRARQALVEELGLEPSPALQRLERGILNHDPALQAPAGVSRIDARSPSAGEAVPAPTRPAGRSRVRLRWRTMGVVVAVALAGSIGAALALTTRGAHGVAVIAPNSLAVIDARSGKLETQISVTANPGPLAAGDGLVWLSNLDQQTVTEIDVQTRKVVATVPLDNLFGAVTTGGGAAWAVEPAPIGAVVRLLPRSARPAGTLPIHGCGEPPGAPVSTFAAGKLWFICSDATFGSVDANRQRVSTRPYPGGYYSKSVAAADGRLWALNDQRNVEEYDPVTNEIETTINVGNEAVALVAGASSLWVTNSGSDTVSRVAIESSSGLPPNIIGVRTIDVGHEPTAIAYGQGAIWVTNQADHSISRIDPATNVVTKTIKVGARSVPVGIAVTNREVWLTTQSAAP